MKHTKKKTVLLLVCALLIGLTACGSSGTATKDAKYPELVQFLDNGQYDAAITLIEEMKAVSQIVPTTPEDLDAEKTELLNRIVGTYSYVYSGEYEPITIHSDMTVTYEGKTYPCTLEIEGADKWLQYTYKNDAGNNCWNSINVNVLENGLICLNGSYFDVEAVKEAGKDQYQRFVGKYISAYSWTDYKEITINEDYTIEMDNEVFEITPYYDKYDQEFRFSYPTTYGYYNDLSIDITEQGITSLMSGYYRVDQIAYVEITADNINDYFEWTDWVVSSSSYNGFNELEYVSLARYYQLKEEYAPYYLSELSSVAIEIEYKEIAFNNAIISFNIESNEITVKGTDPEKSSHYDYDSNTRVLDYIYISGHYDEDDHYIRDHFYLLNQDTGLNLTSDSTTSDGPVYSKTDWLYDNYYTNGITVLRSNTTLAFANTNQN